MQEKGFRLPVAVRCPSYLCQAQDECYQFTQSFKYEIANWLTSAFEKESGLVVSSGDWSELCVIESTGYREWLGRELNFIIVDGSYDFSANAVAALSGTLKAGGILLILVPEQSRWSTSAQPEQQRLFGENLITESRFLNRVGDFFEAQECIHLTISYTNKDTVTQQLETALEKELVSPNPFLIDSPSSTFKLNTVEQQGAIEAIKRVFTGHAKRHLALLADRGRGKSSALGMAIADLVSRSDKMFCITAFSRTAVKQVFEWFEQGVYAECIDRLTFVPMDQVIELLQSNGFSYDGLIVDEAAAIPVHQLETLVTHYNRIVFTSTVHGYEGTGRGFTYRFLPSLLNHAPQAKILELKQPIRWANGDPLEQWINNLFILKPQSKPDSIINNGSVEVANLSFDWFSPDQEVKDDILIDSFQLLVDAHYQTTPDDFRQLLEHPSRYLGVLKNKSEQVVAVILVLQEGGLRNPVLSQIAHGERRLRGHLVAQSLAFHCQQPELATLISWRVQRIAVAPEYQSKGLGSKLLSQLKEQASAADVSFLSTTYAVTQDVLTFWLRNRFQPIRLGLSLDRVSGCHSCLMVYAIQTEEKINQLIDEFYERTRHLSSGCYQTVSADVLRLFWCEKEFVKKQLRKLNQSHLDNLQRFSLNHQSLEDASLIVLELLDSAIEQYCINRRYENQQEHDVLLAKDMALLIAKCWQKKTIKQLNIEFALNGKKEVEQQIKSAVRNILQKKLYLNDISK